MNLLITGAYGQVGKELINHSQADEFNIVGFSHKDLDITSYDLLEHKISGFKPDLVINAAAYTQVEKAEFESSLAFKVNGNGPGYLAKVCSLLKIPLIHLSTDYVFDGKKKGFYKETDQVNPINIYGRSKWFGEEEIRNNSKKYIIIRTSNVFGQYGHNFVKTMLKIGRKKTINIVNDLSSCPTEASAIADAVFDVINVFSRKKELEWGTYHYCGKENSTFYDFAKIIFQTANKIMDYPIPDIIPITSKEFPSQLIRPQNTALSCSKIENVFNVIPISSKIGINKVIRTIGKSKKI